MTAKRRSKGEGSVTEYRKGHFRAFLDLGKDPDTGKRIRKSFTGKTKAEVISKLNKAKYEKQEGLLVINKETPLSLFCKHWLAVKQPNVRESSYAVYEHLVKTFISPTIGKKAVSAIGLIELNEFFSRLQMAQASKVRLKAVLHGIFKLAVKEQLIASNPMELLDPIKNPQKEIKALTVAEVKTLLSTAKAFMPFYYIIKLTLETGMRRGEILALHWSDIDFKTNTVSIKRNLQVIDGLHKIGEPKTQRSKRTISVSPGTLKELLSIKKEDNDIIFSNAGGNYMDTRRFSYTFKKIIKEAGLRPDIRFHDLRHTNATLLIAKGINMKTVSERLGHSSITITMDRYTHGVQEEDQKAAKVIDDLL